MRPTTSTRVIRTGVAALGLVSVGAGLWALLAPHSFYDAAATFPPYNRHFIHDIGAFLIGLGGCLAAALVLVDALLVVLAGNALGHVAHVAAHVADRSIGGRSSDPYTVAVVAVVVVGLTLARLRAVAAAGGGAAAP